MNRRAWLLVGLWLLLWAVWQGTHLDAFSFDYDEGVHLMQARLVLEGLHLYRDMHALLPPLWFWTAAGAFALLGTTVSTGRLLILGYTLLAAGSIAALSRRLGGPRAALLAIVFFTLSPGILMASRTVLLELPAVSLALLALAVAASAGPRPAWWAGAGAAFAASLMIKPVVPTTIIPLVWLVLAQPRERWLRLVAALGVGTTLPAAAVVLLSTPHLFWEQTLAIRAVMRAAFPWDPVSNLLMIWSDGVGPTLGMLLLALVGFWVLRRNRLAQALALWALTTLVVLFFHTPLRPHHLISLPAMLAPLAAGSVGLLDSVVERRRPLRRLAGLAALVVLLGLPVAASPVAASYSEEAGWNDTLVQLIEFIEKHAGSDQQVVIDYPMLAFRAGRSVPPSLADSSDGRILSGALNTGQAIEATARSQAPLIVLWSGRFERLPEYVRWIEDNYVVVGHFDKGRRPVYGARRYAADFGGKIRLAMTDVDQRVAAPGDRVRATLSLQSLAPMTINYNRLLRLVAADGRELWRAEGWPWGAPTAEWPLNEFRLDGHEIVIPGDTLPGLYALTAGFYDPATFEPLVITAPKSDEPTGETDLVVALVRVGPPPTAESGLEPEPQFTEPVAGGSWRPVARLAGVTLPAVVAPGTELSLALLWESVGHTRVDYTAFVHILAPDGTIVAQHDRQPLAGFAPTHLWRPGERLLDEYRIALPPDLAAGRYSVRVGLYTLAAGRLAVMQNGASAGDYVTVGAIIVQ